MKQFGNWNSNMPHAEDYWEQEMSRECWSKSPPHFTHHPETPEYHSQHPSYNCGPPPFHGPPRYSYHSSYAPPKEGLYQPWASPEAPPTSGYYPSFCPPYSSAPPPPDRVPPSVVYVRPSMSSSSIIYDITDKDVLCGRGAPTTFHPGNQLFRKLVDDYQHDYLAAKRIDKPEIASKIVDMVEERGGRFLKRIKVVGGGPSGHFGWVEIGEQRAYEKACQALREGAPELRRQLAAKELAALNQSSDVDMRNDRSEGSSEHNLGLDEERSS